MIHTCALKVHLLTNIFTFVAPIPTFGAGTPKNCPILSFLLNFPKYERKVSDFKVNLMIIYSNAC